GGRLAVSAGYQHRAVTQPPGDGAQGRRVDFRHDVAGNDRTAASAEASVRSLPRSEEHTSELQSLTNLVCRLLLEKKKALLRRDTNRPLRTLSGRIPTYKATPHTAELDRHREHPQTR